MPSLYVVGTPIGNLGDMSERAVSVLKEVDFIAAEDTRVTVKLLNRFEIKKPLVSYYEHNIRERGQYIIERILAGESCAIVSDAGMPCISDPGEDLVRLCAENGIETTVIPGPSAVISALAVSGLKTSRFCFEGFLSTVKKNRYEHLESLKDESRTMIFYEAPHKLNATLKDMNKAFGRERRISFARELTKIHEEVFRTTIGEAIEHYADNPPRGEFVLVIEGAPKAEKTEISLEEVIRLGKNAVKDGEKATDAAKRLAKEYGFAKAQIYTGIIPEADNE